MTQPFHATAAGFPAVSADVSHAGEGHALSVLNLFSALGPQRNWSVKELARQRAVGSRRR